MGEFNPYEAIYMSRMGDHSAHTALFQSYYPRMKQQIMYTIQQYQPYRIYEKDFEQIAMLVLEDVVLTWRNDQVCSFSTYYNVLLKRGITDVLRKYSKITKVNAHEVIGFDDEVSNHHCCGSLNRYQNVWNKQEFTIEFYELYDRLKDFQKTLNPQQKLLYACWEKGFSYQEGADVLGITPSQYGGRLYRLKKKLKRFLKDETSC